MSNFCDVLGFELQGSNLGPREIASIVARCDAAFRREERYDRYDGCCNDGYPYPYYGGYDGFYGGFGPYNGIGGYPGIGGFGGIGYPGAVSGFYGGKQSKGKSVQSQRPQNVQSQRQYGARPIMQNNMTGSSNPKNMDYQFKCTADGVCVPLNQSNEYRPTIKDKSQLVI